MSDLQETPTSAHTARRRRRSTISEVARLAGVSPTTVSHVFSGKRLVSTATRERVLEAVQHLDYRPNNAARHLRTSRSHMIAVIVPDITNPFYSVLTRGVGDAAHASEYGTYVCNTDGLVQREHLFIEDVLDRGVDGVVMAAVNVSWETIVKLADAGTSFVCVGADIDSPHVDRVIADDEGGSFAATMHLIRRGARQVGMIHGRPESGLARIEGYRRALMQAGRPVSEECLVAGDWTREGGREAMRRLMALPLPPDAVFCANDLMAIGAMDVLHELGLSIPQDVALAGFDDIDAATLVRPALTTVRNPAYEAGRAAGDLLVARMGGHAAPGPRVTVLPCPLVERASA